MQGSIEDKSDLVNPNPYAKEHGEEEKPEDEAEAQASKEALCEEVADLKAEVSQGEPAARGAESAVLQNSQNFGGPEKM